MRIGIIVFSRKQVHTVFNSKLIRELETYFQISKFTIDDDVLQLESFHDARRIPRFPLHCRRLQEFINQTALWKYRENSYAFKLKANALFGRKKDQKEWTNFITYDLELNGLKRFFVRLMSNEILNHFLRKCLSVLRFSVNRKEYSDLFDNCDLMIIPYSGHDSSDFHDFNWVSRKLGKSTFIIQENWDNLSSKNVITEDVDYFGVWGEQSAKHLKSMHQCQPKSIFLLGSPRFDDYYATGQSRKAIKGSKKKVLIAGSRNTLEDSVLIESILAVRDEIQLDVELIYRPHPANRGGTTRNTEQFKFLYEGMISEQKGSDSRESKLLEQISESDLIVCHLSTLVLEGLILNRPICIPLFAESNYPQIYRKNYQDLLYGLEHFKGISEFELVRISKDKSELILQVRESLLRDGLLRKKSNVDWYCKPGNFIEQLLRAIRNVSEEFK